METAMEVCLVCDASPTGYVRVVDKDDEIVGRICSSHTLWEVIRLSLFDIRIQFTPNDEDNA